MEDHGIPEESPFLVTTFREVLELLDDDEREALDARMAALGLTPTQDLDTLFETLRAMLERLDDDDDDLLFDALERQSPTIDWEDLDPTPLIERGLVVPVTLGETSYFVIPIEVRIAAMRGTDGELPPPLAVHLYFADDEDLEEIAGFYQVDGDMDADLLDTVIAVADAALERDTILRAFSSLSPLARRLLIWLAGTTRQPQLSAYEDMAQRLATSPTEARTAMRVLARLGYVHRAPFAEDHVQVPVDVMTMLWELLDDDLVGASTEAYNALRARVVPALRDTFPRGAGGDPLGRARQDFMDALLGRDLPDRTLWNLNMLRIYDASDEAPGEWASRLLDLSGPDAFSRSAIRAWLGIIGDDYTQRLVAAVGGDARAINAALFAAADAARDDEHVTGLLQEWNEFLYVWRVHLVLLLSLLPAGHWYRLDALAAWMVGQYRLTRWQRGYPMLFRPLVTDNAMPAETVEIGPRHVPRMTTALRHLFKDLFEPLGAVMLDATETLLLPNPESLRAVRDHDPHFDAIWRDADRVVGSDLDLWLPGPTELGNRVTGPARLRWHLGAAIAIPADAHLSDLVRLCQWADPVAHRDRFLFFFSDESVHRGESLGADHEEMLVWLQTRTGQAIPPTVRAHFKVSTSATDHDADPDEVVGLAYAVDVLEQLESWSGSPTGALIEELRSWGDATVAALTPFVEARVREGRWDPLLRHALLVLGDMRADGVSPELLRALAFTPDREVEVAAAMACARIGDPVVEGLVSLLHNGAADVNKRLAAGGTLSALSVLHPQHCERVARELSHMLLALDDDPETATIAALSLAETGHASAEKTLYELRERNAWVDEVLPFNEALWIAGVSPAIWGPPTVAAPLAHVFLTASERRSIEEAAELGEVLASADESTLGSSRQRWRRRD